MGRKYYEAKVDMTDFDGDDDRILTIKWHEDYYGFAHPDNDVGDPTYELGGRYVERDRLPKELTDEILKASMDDGRENHGFGDREPSDY